MGEVKQYLDLTLLVLILQPTVTFVCPLGKKNFSQTGGGTNIFASMLHEENKTL